MPSDNEVYKSLLLSKGVPPRTITDRYYDLFDELTKEEFYTETKKDAKGIPDAGFRPRDVVEAFGLAENSRETIRKDLLIPLKNYGILNKVVPKPRSPKTYWILKEDAKNHIEEYDGVERGEIPELPEIYEANDQLLSLPYHDEEIDVAPGEHTTIMASALADLVPELASNPKLIHHDLDDNERDDIVDGDLFVSIDETQYRLSKYPDLIVYDEGDDTIYFIEAVHSSGQTTEPRIETVKEDLQASSKSGSLPDLQFITAFADVKTYRSCIPDFGDSSVWLMSQPNKVYHLSSTEIDVTQTTEPRSTGVKKKTQMADQESQSQLTAFSD